MAVATGSDRQLFNLKSQKHQEVFRLFKTITAGDDPGVKEAKPAPDVYLLAAKELGAIEKKTWKDAWL